MTWLKGLNELSRRGIPEVANLFYDHHAGDEYDLPSLEQLLWTIMSLTGVMPAYSVPDSFAEFAWSPQGAKPYRSTFEIATKMPMRNSNGEEFWDLAGNASVITKSLFELPPESKPQRKVLGGSFLLDSFQGVQLETTKSLDVGFRIIRRRNEPAQ